MIERGKFDEFVCGLRETLLSQAAAKAESEKRDSPAAVAARREQIESQLADMDDLRFDRGMSDDAFWTIAALKPFYAGKRAGPVDKRAVYMLDNYLADRESLDSPEWDDGGQRFQAFLSEEGCYRHKGALKKTIYAARRINEWKRVNTRSIAEFYTHGLKEFDSVEALQTIHARLQCDFRYGVVTIYHLMTELGLRVVKPDRVLNRSSIRMGLIESYRKGNVTYDLPPSITTERANTLGSKPDFTWTLQGIYREISEATGVSMRSLDYIVVKLGQDPVEESGFARTVCHADRPLCNVCIVKPMCAYGSQR